MVFKPKMTEYSVSVCMWMQLMQVVKFYLQHITILVKISPPKGFTLSQQLTVLTGPMPAKLPMCRPFHSWEYIVQTRTSCRMTDTCRKLHFMLPSNCTFSLYVCLFVCLSVCLFCLLANKRVHKTHSNTLFITSAEGGYVFGSVCLSVHLSVCPSNNWKSCEQILTEFLGGVGHGPGIND